MAKKEKQVKENKKNQYFKDMKAELKKVVWPTPKQLVNNTIGVIAFVLIFAVIVFILDVCFNSLNKYGITRLQEKVQSSFSSSETENSENESNENTDSQEKRQSEENNEQLNKSSESVQDEDTNTIEESGENNTLENKQEINE